MNESTAPRALLIAPKYFDYENDIATELTCQGMQVDMLPDRPFNTPFKKAVLRFRPELGHRRSTRFFLDSVERFGRTHYNIIIVVQGEGMTVEVLDSLRQHYRAAKFVFYMWDSIENKPFAKRQLPHYDRVSTFDPIDAKKYGMHNRPLFFGPGFDRPARQEFAYDLSFIGTVHSDRYRIIKSLVGQLQPDTKTYIYCFLQAPWMYDARRLFSNTVKGAKRSEFHFHPLSKDAVQATFFGSRAVLDIEHPNQRGVTMRTIEALGSRTKMITTNETVKNMDFYNPHNVLVIDRNHPKLDSDFLRTPYCEVPEEVRHRYSLRQWVKDVCGH